MTKLIVALFFLGLNGYVYWYMGNDEVTPARTAFAEFPSDLGDVASFEHEGRAHAGFFNFIKAGIPFGIRDGFGEQVRKIPRTDGVAAENSIANLTR